MVSSLISMKLAGKTPTGEVVLTVVGLLLLSKVHKLQRELGLPDYCVEVCMWLPHRVSRVHQQAPLRLDSPYACCCLLYCQEQPAGSMVVQAFQVKARFVRRKRRCHPIG